MIILLRHSEEEGYKPLSTIRFDELDFSGSKKRHPIIWIKSVITRILQKIAPKLCKKIIRRLYFGSMLDVTAEQLAEYKLEHSSPPGITLQ
jgi:hypothetical protein